MRRVLSRLVTLGCTCPRKIDTLIAPVFGLVVRPTRPHSVYSSSFKRSSAVFIDNENSNAHNTMVNDPAYSRTVVSRDNRIDLPTVTEAQFRDLIAENFRPSTAEKTCDDFQKVTAYAISSGFALVDATLDTLREQLVAVLPTMTDDQLIAVFKLISLWNTKDVNDPKYKKLWSLFDEQCIERHQNWSVDKLLLVMDHWYIMNLLRFSEFVMVGVSKLASKPFRLTPKQLVQMMFYANASRKFSPSLPMYDIEQHICSNYNEFNIKELGIISLGFFKTQTHIQSQELVKNLYTSIINQIININSYELAAFLKILRYCTMHKNADSMYKLMDILTEKVDKVDLVCCTHMALLGTNLLIRHKELLKKISQQMIKKISQARIKDIERITLALTMLNYNPHTTPCIFEMVVNELRSDSRNIDFEIYTKCYISTLMSLAVNGIFPYDCISKALQYETLIRCYKKELSKSILPRDVLSLNNSVIIECPDYSGPLLSVELNKSCNEHTASHIPTSSITVKKTVADRNFLKLYRELLLLFKNEAYLHVCYPLPHHPKTDILFCIDTKGRPIIIPEIMKNKIVFNEFKKPPELGKWFAIMILVRNSILFHSDEYNGLTACKIRQLTKLGYKPILWTKDDYQRDIHIHFRLLEKLKAHGVILN